MYTPYRPRYSSYIPKGFYVPVSLPPECVYTPESKIPIYHHESERLRSFKNWPLAFIRPSQLAEAGFYFLRVNDHVRCAYCGIEIGSWEEGDVPVSEHRRHNPKCVFLNEVYKKNI